MSDIDPNTLLETKELTPQQQKMYAVFCKSREGICDTAPEPSSSLLKLAEYKAIKLDKNKISSARNWRTAGVATYWILYSLLATAIACMPMISGDQLPYVLLFTTPISVILFALAIYRVFTTTKRDWDFPTAMGWVFWLAMVFVVINTIVVLAKNATFVPALINMFNASLAGSIIGFGVLALGAIFAFSSFLRSSKLENDVTANAKLSPKNELHLMVMLKIYDHMCAVEYNRPWSPITLDKQKIADMVKAETSGATNEDKMLAIADKLANFYVTTSRLVTFNLSAHKLVNIIKTGKTDEQPSASVNLSVSSSDTSTNTNTLANRHPAVVASSASLLGIADMQHASEHKL